MQHLRVGLFTECYRPIRNGVVASVDALATDLRAGGHEVVCVTPLVPGYRESASGVVRVPSLPLPTRTEYRLTIPFLGRKQRTQMLSQLSIVHAHSPFVTGWMGARFARRHKVPFVYTYHTQLEEYAHYVPFEARTARRVASGITRSFANSADAVVVPTAAMERRLRALGVQSRIEVVPTGIDVAFFAGGARRADMRARLGAREAERLVLMVGRLGREKNVPLALESFARLNDAEARLAIVGDGTEREALEAYARRLGIAGRTAFAREFAREELPDAYASADAFLFTSSTETQGLVLVEAMAARLPVVAVDSPQTREVVGDAANLVPADAGKIAAALRAALQRRERPRWEQAGGFDRVRLNRRMLDVYESLLEARPAMPIG